MVLSSQKSSVLVGFALAASLMLSTPPVSANAATMYWDCCKPSAAWGAKGSPIYNPVAVCLEDGRTIATGPRRDAPNSSGCGGGNEFQCSCQQPWSDHANPELGYGFAAMSTQSEAENACACYVVDFAGAKPGKVKTLFYQVINTGADVGGGGLDILVPGMGIGAMTQGCPAQWKTDVSKWGNQYGGLDRNAEGCSNLPRDLQHGCLWRMNQWGDSVNMAGQPRRVKCSKAHIDRTGCQRKDEGRFPAFSGVHHGGDAEAAPDRYTPNAAVCGIGHSRPAIGRRHLPAGHLHPNPHHSSHRHHSTHNHHSSHSHQLSYSHYSSHSHHSSKGHHPGQGHHAGKAHHDGENR